MYIFKDYLLVTHLKTIQPISHNFNWGNEFNFNLTLLIVSPSDLDGSYQSYLKQFFIDNSTVIFSFTG